MLSLLYVLIGAKRADFSTISIFVNFLMHAENTLRPGRIARYPKAGMRVGATITAIGTWTSRGQIQPVAHINKNERAFSRFLTAVGI